MNKASLVFVAAVGILSIILSVIGGASFGGLLLRLMVSVTGSALLFLSIRLITKKYLPELYRENIGGDESGSQINLVLDEEGDNYTPDASDFNVTSASESDKSEPLGLNSNLSGLGYGEVEEDDDDEEKELDDLAEIFGKQTKKIEAGSEKSINREKAELEKFMESSDHKTLAEAVRHVLKTDDKG